MRNINKNKPIQPLSFWDKLEDDVDKIGDRAKEKLQIYQQNKYQKLNNNPENKNCLKFNTSKLSKPIVIASRQSKNNKSLDVIPNNMKRRDLIELVKNENLKKQEMKNRLAYLKQNKQRQNKTIQLAKKKFEHIKQVRTQSFKQKQALKKKIVYFQKQNKNYKSGIVNTVKISRQKRNMSLQSYKSEVSERANSIRAQTINNQSFANFQKVKSRQQNTERARKTKDSINRSRSIVYEVKQKKIESAKNYRNYQLTERLMALKQEKKNNQMIFNKLRFQAEKLNKWKSRAQQQIQQYRNYLGITTRNSQIKQSSKNSERNTKPFYITSHY